MANRTFNQYSYTIQKRPCVVWVVAAMPEGTTPILKKYNYGTFGVGGQTYSTAPTTGGGSGFPNRYAQGAEGVYSLARTGAGLWTITLQDNYQRVLGLRVDMSIAGGLSNIVAIGENSTISNMGAAGGSVIGVALLSSTGTAADPTAAASSLVRIRIELQDATEP